MSREIVVVGDEVLVHGKSVGHEVDFRGVVIKIEDDYCTVVDEKLQKWDVEFDAMVDVEVR
jgi:hypothetical protein